VVNRRTVEVHNTQTKSFSHEREDEVEGLFHLLANMQKRAVESWPDERNERERESEDADKVIVHVFKVKFS
jgi:hypothetical protein